MNFKDIKRIKIYKDVGCCKKCHWMLKKSDKILENTDNIKTTHLKMKKKIDTSQKLHDK